MISMDDEIPVAISSLNAWFDTMRCREGYGGPVAHWWHNGLQYTGAGLDWRYEGIILGYLTLYEKTMNQRWLEKALRAGNDLIAGQGETGNFRNSSFEMNPKGGGTPHEAAVCIALLSLAKTLEKVGNPRYKKFLAAAKHNIEKYYISRLWDNKLKMFRDSLYYPSFVPNKSATLTEALCLLAELLNDYKIVEKCAVPTADLIIKHQFLDEESELYGAVHQMSLLEKDEFKFTRKFFPFYISRCVPAMLRVAEVTGDEKYINSAKAAVDFVLKTSYKDGSFPQVVYPKGKVARNPQWVAGVGDILRAFRLVSKHGGNINLKKPLGWLLKGLDECGGMRTAHGFAVQTSSEEYTGIPDFRDLLHVCGWNDKAFRFLTEILPEDSEIPEPGIKEFKAQCIYKKREFTFYEDMKRVSLTDSGREIYKWRKGDAWAEMNIKLV